MAIHTASELSRAHKHEIADSNLFADYSPSVRLLKEEIIHELGCDLMAEPVERVVDIEPSRSPVRLIIKSEVQTDGAKRLRSAVYMATVRRREAKVLTNEFAVLMQHLRRDDFAVATFPVTERIKKLLNILADAEQEGNTREILRRIRDSIQNGGWENYRKPEVCKAVASILAEIAELEEIMPGHVAAAARKMAGAGLDSVRNLFDLIDDNDPPEPSK